MAIISTAIIKSFEYLEVNEHDLSNFSRMEAIDSALIKRSDISLFDSRLRTARDTRFNLYEKSCSRAARKGIRLDESMMFELFELCQYMAFKTCGLKVSSIEPSGNQELLTLVQEAHK